MAIEFEFYESPDPTGENEGKYHARPVIYRTVTTAEMAGKIQEASSLTIGDVKAVLSALNAQIANNLEDSNRIHLEGIGFFEPTLKTSRDIEPGKTRAQSVFFKSVSFRADKQLKKRLMNVRTKRAERKTHSATLNNDEVDEKVKMFFKENDILNTRILRFLCGFTPYTANKHIKRLAQGGKIRNIYTKQHPVYVKGNI